MNNFLNFLTYFLNFVLHLLINLVEWFNFVLEQA